MVSLKGMFNVDISYPGIEIAVELIVLEEYLKQMEAGIRSVSEKYIDEELSEFKGSDPSEYQHVFRIAEDKMPRTIRMPFVVTTYTLFENSVNSLLAHAQKKENQALCLKDINGKSLVSRYNKYQKHILGYEFQFGPQASEKISMLNKVRNCVAHTNGNLGSMPQPKIDQLKAISEREPGIKLNQDELALSQEFLAYSLGFVCEAIRDLMKYMEKRYGYFEP